MRQHFGTILDRKASRNQCERLFSSFMFWIELTSRLLAIASSFHWSDLFSPLGSLDSEQSAVKVFYAREQNSIVSQLRGRMKRFEDSQISPHNLISLNVERKNALVPTTSATFFSRYRAPCDVVGLPLWPPARTALLPLNFHPTWRISWRLVTQKMRSVFRLKSSNRCRETPLA